MKILHSDLVAQALEQLGPPLTAEPPIHHFKAYTQLIRGLSLHVSGAPDMAYMTLSRYIDKGPPIDVSEELAEVAPVHFYWRTAIMRMFEIANDKAPIALGDIRWLQKIDPILFTALSLVVNEKLHLVCFRLMHHYRLEVAQERAIGFLGLEESMQRTPHERKVAMYLKKLAEEQAAKAPKTPATPPPDTRGFIEKLLDLFKKPKKD
ncbi:hypothetical protein [Pseudomonas putida]|uniref:Uncharacterized protein n=1 Tax=Pseudomonas putida TaxID=303 RepID=A0A8I1ECM1_PSEPU|nr:hypothetical protein [Pseudomonas putida]MBI6883201.1 hypothetical protein [Pseudomonas putida]